jgi:hypothetical protein
MPISICKWQARAYIVSRYVIRKGALVFRKFAELCVALRDLPNQNHGNLNVLCIDSNPLLTALSCISDIGISRIQ